MKLKTVKRFTKIFKSLQFNSSIDDGTEFLSLQSTYDEDGKPVEELKYFEDGTVDERNIFLWENKQLISHIIEMPQEGMREEYRYARTQDGKLTKEQKFYGDDPGEATEYFYNADGQMEKVIKYDADGEKEHEEQFEFENKLLKVHRIYDSSGSLISASEFTNENGRPAGRKETDETGNTVHETTYEYDDKGNLIKTVTKNTEGKVIESYVVSFDEKGNIIEKAIRDFIRVPSVTGMMTRTAVLKKKCIMHSDNCLPRLYMNLMQPENLFPKSITTLTIIIPITIPIKPTGLSMDIQKGRGLTH